MKKVQKIEAKQRIFNAARSLFAQKGYDAVGTREIAKSANVNIAMINYYYKGKIGILKEIITLGYHKYYSVINEVNKESVPLEERVHKLVRGMIKLYRENLELMIVTISLTTIDLPEILDLRYNLMRDHRSSVDTWFREFGVNLSDEVQIALIRNFLTSTIYQQFENKFFWEKLKQAPVKPEFFEAKMKEEKCEDRIDEEEFYDRYADMLAEFYFQGMRAVVRKYNKGG
jgi:AcrR family transcriptional regulator